MASGNREPTERNLNVSSWREQRECVYGDAFRVPLWRGTGHGAAVQLDKPGIKKSSFCVAGDRGADKNLFFCFASGTLSGNLQVKTALNNPVLSSM